MGALPDLLPGYQKVVDQAARDRFEEAWGVSSAPEPGLRIPQMFDAAIDGELRRSRYSARTSRRPIPTPGTCGRRSPPASW